MKRRTTILVTVALAAAAVAAAAALVTTTAGSAEIAPPEGLADYAAKTAANYGDAAPLSAQYVETTVGEAAPVFGLASESMGAEVDEAAYVVVMRGKFEWPLEQWRGGPPTTDGAVEPPSGEWLVVLVTRDAKLGLVSYNRGIGPYAPDTTSLGELKALPFD